MLRYAGVAAVAPLAAFECAARFTALIPLERTSRPLTSFPQDTRATGSLLTLRWREMDSNFRFRTREATDLSFRFLSMSLKLSAF